MQEANGAATEWRPKHSHWLVACAVILPTFIEVLDTTIVSVAIMHIAGSLSSSYEETLWITTSYLVANAIILPASGWLATRFGRKQYLLASVACFTLSLFMCGAATSLNMLVLARVIQGFAGGGLQPLSQAIILESFPKHQSGLGMAIYGMGCVVAPVLGPVAGGWMLDHYSWPWMFYFEIPFGILALLLVAKFVEDPPYIRDAKPGSIDTIGFGFMALWLGTLQVMLDKGQTWDWLASNAIVALGAISMVSMVAFIVWELWGTTVPIVDLRVFRNRNFFVGTFLIGFLGVVLYAVMTIHPQFLQTLLGYTAYNSGLVQSPRGIGTIFAMPIAGLLMTRMDSRKIIVFGLIVFAAGTFMLHTLNLEIAMKSMVMASLLQSCGTAFLFVPLSVSAMAGLKNTEMGNASGVFNLSRNIGGAIGISLVTTYLTRNAQLQQVQLVSHLTPYDPMYQMSLQQVSHIYGSVYGHANALEHAHGAIYGVLVQQSNLISFSNGFLLLAVILMLLIPPTFLLRKSTAPTGPVVVH